MMPCSELARAAYSPDVADLQICKCLFFIFMSRLLLNTNSQLLNFVANYIKASYLRHIYVEFKTFYGEYVGIYIYDQYLYQISQVYL
jgi:hypothetical protein